MLLTKGLFKQPLNDERYPEDDSIQSARGFWVKASLHPPHEDPRLT
ncbi:hypothetical protein LC653_00355 [Nostoc sp. CHAB 5784]|nr:hypothetical protein [Nostoc mirabile]MCC5662424.1 hypothetical protein [Nostoc mirabile CHAB5784]